MEFAEILQRLRKQREWTQEQLAEKLFVSRTAVSKWESGKGYPNIDSLKSISRLFSVSIDDLLSGEEIVSLAAEENRANIRRIYCLIYGILDVMALIFLFLPLYARQDGDMIRMVNVFGNPDALIVTRIVYFVWPILTATLGIAELIIQHLGNERQIYISGIGSVLLQALAILVFVATRQPYAAALLFLFFLIKVMFLIKRNRINQNQ
ncbi:MAG: helix-turn-helix domain-containing protein [Oscillospiraceae bacterium]|jgi:transcriptional regulator with XRE-family HTH domain|nr:helix-turn-helix domain-containing protein [Oscillospiraceae bacterium]